MHFAVGIDIRDALLHHFRLVPPHRRAESDELSVQIGGRNHVRIDQGEFPHAAARERFRRIRTDAAQPEQRHVRTRKFPHAALPEKGGCSAIKFFHKKIILQKNAYLQAFCKKNFQTLLKKQKKYNIMIE